MKENRALETSLACLQHQMSLLCIGILLLNDHVLKVAFPSWLTGKLSDFAGLFFFPFIVAAGMSLLPGRFKLDAMRIGHLSFGIVAVWFTALKTIPTANSVTAQLAGAILGRPSEFALDATDLIALSALLPAWVLWNRQPAASPRRLAYVALFVGAIAAMATSPAPMPSYTEKLAFKDGVTYALADSYGLFMSRDAGATWDRCDQGSCPDMPNFDQPRNTPLSTCDLQSPELCFRIHGKTSIESSADHGRTWSLAWEVPPARIPYMGRRGVSVEEMAARDLIIVPGSKSTLLVAMGRAGILRRALPDGEWQWVSVGYSEAVSYEAPYYSEAMMDTALELGVWVLISIALLMAGGFLIWMTASPETMGLLRLVGWMLQLLGSAVGTVVLTAGLIALFLGLVLGGIRLPDWMNSDDFILGAAATSVFASLFLSFQWNVLRLLRRLVGDIRTQRTLFFIVFSMAVANCAGALVIWPLWAVGVIWDYTTALVLAGGVTGVALAVGALLIRRETARSEGQ